MIETLIDTKEKAILVALNHSGISKAHTEEYLSELELLTETAGADTVFRIIQDRDRIDSAFYIGKGKAEEIARLAEMNDIKLVIFDDDLTPTQVRNLEKLIERKILDRSGLILDIFSSHARTNEAKTQVELAQLQYMLPRLSRAWTHLSKQYGGIGTKGPGETQIETDRRMIRTRISKLKEKLKSIESQQVTKSVKRKDFVKASLVGYTNAGKSTLLNLLTGAGVLAEDMLFATLDSTTRALELEKNRKLLVSDTVGFIRKLPHHLVASFKSTLNVVREADIILHVIDISHPFFEEHIHIVNETLKDLKCDKKTQLKIFNKVDALADRSKIDYVLSRYPDSVMVSAQRQINIVRLKELLLKLYEENFGEYTIELNIGDSKTLSTIYSLAKVTNVVYEEEKILVTFASATAVLNKINSALKK